MKLPEVVETERLLIRRVFVSDAARIHRAVLESFAALNPWMVWAKTPPKFAAILEYAQSSVQDYYACTGWNALMWSKRDGRLVGSGGYPRLEWSVPRFEIGYWLHTACTGQGYATEATWALACHAFDHLAAERVELRIDDRNHRSFAVAERLGFVREALLRSDMRANDGSLRDTRVYSLLRDEYAALATPVRATD